jgi:endogenous inhibitor of DNA gyrase (YacG/DUF329 family)
VRFDLHASSAPPFCSPRCRRADLGRWFNEDYAMPIPRDEDDPDEAGPGADEQHDSESADADE